MSESSSRPVRANRGNRMADLLKQAENEVAEDDFYEKLEDESDDGEWDSSSSEEDEVDSDFDDPEENPANEEDGNAGLEEIEMATASKRRKIVYHDPAKEKPKQGSVTTEKKKATKKSRSETPVSASVRKSSRSATVQNSTQRDKREKERKRLKKSRRSKPKAPEVQLTQEELLEEAKITEQYNLASLELLLIYEEEENRKRREKRKPVIQGPSVVSLSNNDGNYVIFSSGELPQCFSESNAVYSEQPVSEETNIADQQSDAKEVSADAMTDVENTSPVQ